VITEMLQDSRMGSSWCKPLIFGNQEIIEETRSYHGSTITRAGSIAGGYSTQGGNQRVFRKLWKWVRDSRRPSAEMDDKTFCRTVFSESVCTDRYPQERYSEVNLVVLDRYGTMEFRGFPASNDPERVLQWVQFLLKFVDKTASRATWFGTTSADHDGEADYTDDLIALVAKQREASWEDLASLLELPEAATSYWTRKPWLTGKACKTPERANEPSVESTNEAALAAQETLASTPVLVVKTRAEPDSPDGDTTEIAVDANGRAGAEPAGDDVVGAASASSELELVRQPSGPAVRREA